MGDPDRAGVREGLCSVQIKLALIGDLLILFQLAHKYLGTFQNDSVRKFTT
jgi:hypothetical protein